MPEAEQDLTKITLPGYICRITPEEKALLEQLFFRFGNVRRRAYALKQKGWIKSEIVKRLQEESGLNSRYVSDAYHSIKDLPPHVTFGGLKNQRLRETGKISKEEYKRRRNSIIISRGDKSKKGNLNIRLRLETMELRINTGSNRRWIYPKIFIPEKYLKRYGHLLDGRRPYTVIIKRRDFDRGYDVRIIVEVPKEKYPIKEDRVMALDANSGHIDFAIAEKDRVLALGKVHCHALRDFSSGKTQNYLHKLIRKICNIAKHYQARVVVGKLRSANFSSHSRANRKVRGMPFYKLAQFLKNKLDAWERSEWGTTKIANKIAPKVGLDVHKVSAALFALKVLKYGSFSSLYNRFSGGVHADEGGGSPSMRLTLRSGLTAPGQGSTALAGDEVAGTACNGGYPAIPGSGGLLFLSSLKTGLPCLHVKR